VTVKNESRKGRAAFSLPAAPLGPDERGDQNNLKISLLGNTRQPQFFTSSNFNGMTQTLRVPQTPQSPEILCKGGAQRSRFLRGSDCTGVLTLSSSSDFHFFQEQKAVFRTKQNHFQRKPSLLAPCRAHTTSGTVPAMRRRGRAGWPRGRAELGQAGHTCFSLPTTHGWQWDPLRALGRPLPTL